MVISVAGSFFSIFNERITGYVTTGTVNVTVATTSSLNVMSNVMFGNGSISSDPASPTSISTENSDNANTFNNCSVINGGVGDPNRDCTGIEVENDGNSFINVTFSASKTVATFFDSILDIGGNFTFVVLDGNRTKNETAVAVVGYRNTTSSIWLTDNNASCLNNDNVSANIRPAGSEMAASGFKNWTVISTAEYLICGNLSFNDGNDTITVEFNVTFPVDEPPGTKTNTFTFTAVQVT